MYKLGMYVARHTQVCMCICKHECMHACRHVHKVYSHVTVHIFDVRTNTAATMDIYVLMHYTVVQISTVYISKRKKKQTVTSHYHAFLIFPPIGMLLKHHITRLHITLCFASVITLH